VALETRTGTRSETVTDSAGQYTSPFLAPGTYDLTAEIAGFKRCQRQGLGLATGEHPVIDIELQLGDVTQNVTVAADTEMIETANASTGQVITSQQVEDFPLNGRTPMMLAQLALGVVSTSTLSNAVHPFDNGGVSSISMVVGASPRPLSVRTEAPLTSVLEMMNRPKARETIVHFINFDRKKPVDRFAVTLRKQFTGPVKKLECFSPDTNEPVALKFQENGDKISFAAPSMRLYSMLVVSQ
jgi:hypothetical protein